MSISAPIPRNGPPTSLNGLDNPYSAGSQANASSTTLRQFRHPNTSLTSLGASPAQPAASTSTSVGRVPVSYNWSPQQQYTPYHLPSPPLSDGGDDIVSLSSMNDGPPPAVIRIETNTRLPARKTIQPSPTRGASPGASPTTQQGITESLAPVPMSRTSSSPNASTSPNHSSPAEEWSSSSSELPHGAAGVGSGHGIYGANGAGRGSLKLHTGNPLYSQSTQSLPATSAIEASQFDHQGMHSDPYLAYSEVHPDSAYSYAPTYPLVKQLSPIAEQDYMSPDSLKRPKSLPPSAPASRVGSEADMRGSQMSQGGSLTHTTASPIGSQTSEVAREFPSLSPTFVLTNFLW